KYLEETVGREQASLTAVGGIAAGEKMSRNPLEDEARESTLWGQAETIAIGRAYIQKVNRVKTWFVGEVANLLYE
ncbi:unnamed protein product, partial [Diplocarpon coronariae]